MMQMLFWMVYTFILIGGLKAVEAVFKLSLSTGETVLFGILFFLISGILSAIYPGNDELVG